PVHASWLNQIEIYFSIVQRKALTPNDFSCIQEVEDRLLRFQEYYENMATPFEWRFTRDDLARLITNSWPSRFPGVSQHEIIRCRIYEPDYLVDCGDVSRFPLETPSLRSPRQGRGE
ncbi:MAG: hypothetical protein ACREXR_23720, partial [Gammaproteobacteria bacterium]